jgi:hypothetical protein
MLTPVNKTKIKDCIFLKKPGACVGFPHLVQILALITSSHRYSYYILNYTSETKQVVKTQQDVLFPVVNQHQDSECDQLKWATFDLNI